MRSPRSGDVLRLVADDCRDTRFEILGRFDWPVHGRTNVLQRLQRVTCVVNFYDFHAHRVGKVGLALQAVK